MVDTKIKTLTDRLENIRATNPSRDPSTVLVKELGALQGEILIELIKTLTELDASNKRLATTNIRLQWTVAGLTLLTFGVAIL